MKNTSRECHSSSRGQLLDVALLGLVGRRPASSVPCSLRCAHTAPVAAASCLCLADFIDCTAAAQQPRDHLLRLRATHTKRSSRSSAATSTNPEDKIGSVFDEQHGDLRIVHGQPRQLGGAGLVEVQMAAHPLHGLGPSRRKDAGSAVKEACSRDVSRG